MVATIELNLALAENTVQKLREQAKLQGVSETMLVEKALSLLFGLDETPVINDYWFSISTMRADWDAMPDNWIADIANCSAKLARSYRSTSD